MIQSCRCIEMHVGHEIQTTHTSTDLRNDHEKIPFACLASDTCRLTMALDPTSL